MKAEVVANRLGLPRMQMRIYEWLRRAPVNVDRLQVLAIGVPDTVILDLSAEEVLQLGMEITAERIYGQCDAVALDNEHETRFAAQWYAGTEIVLYLPFRLGSNLRNGDHYDGSAVSIIVQTQGNLERVMRMHCDFVVKQQQAQTAVIQQLQAQCERLIERDLAVMAKERELRDQELETLRTADVGDSERFLELAIQVIERLGLPANRQH